MVRWCMSYAFVCMYVFYSYVRSCMCRAVVYTEGYSLYICLFTFLECYCINWFMHTFVFYIFALRYI